MGLSNIQFSFGNKIACTCAFQNSSNCTSTQTLYYRQPVYPNFAYQPYGLEWAYLLLMLTPQNRCYGTQRNSSIEIQLCGIEEAVQQVQEAAAVKESYDRRSGLNPWSNSKTKFDVQRHHPSKMSLERFSAHISTSGCNCFVH